MSIRDFSMPNEQYRIKPFWFWNGDIKEDQIHHQIREMKDKGIGGFFICARQGLTVPYLSKRWFELCLEAVRYAKKIGLEVWICDEYPYPSGIAGGEVILKNPAAKKTTLRAYTIQASAGEEIEKHFSFDEILYCAAVPLNKLNYPLWEEALDIENELGILQTTELYQKAGLTAYNNKRFMSYEPHKVLKYTLPDKYMKYIVVVIQQTTVRDFKYFGTFVDGCNRKAMETFIGCTHEKYHQYMGQYFGNTIKGFFSDETGIRPIPWSTEIPATFEEKYEKSLKPLLPALFNNSYPNFARIRYELYQTAHELFRNSFHKQISDWCEEKDLFFITEVPSLRGTTQLHSHVPGGDCCHEKLGRSLFEVLEQNILSYRANAKFISSLARQMNRKFCLVEAFHSIGWSMTLQDAKWQLDRLAIFGINMFNLHAFYYTIDGISKHDAPPSQFLQNPYWKHYRLLSDYAARLSAFVTNTHSSARVAVLDPITTFWTKLGDIGHIVEYIGDDPIEKAQLDDFTRDFTSLCKAMFFSHIEYDHIDPELLAQGIVEQGIISVGSASYEVIVIPPVSNLESLAVMKLYEFVEHGGVVIAVGRLPDEQIELFDAPEKMRSLFNTTTSNAEGYHHKTSPVIRTSGKGTTFFGCSANIADTQTLADLVDFIKIAVPPVFQIYADENSYGRLISATRMDKDTHYLMLQNHGAEKITATIRYSCSNEEVTVFDCSFEDGNYYEAEYSRSGQIFQIPVTLLPYQSRLVGVGKNTDLIKKRKYTTVKLDTTKPMVFNIEGLNVLRLDTFQLHVDGMEEILTSPQTFIESLSSHKELRPKVEYRNAFGIPKKIAIAYPIGVKYSTSVFIEEIPEKIFLLFDKKAIIGRYTICVNDYELNPEHLQAMNVNDFNNRAADIVHLVHTGINTITVEVNIMNDNGGLTDILYLLGDFSLKKKENGYCIAGQKTINILNSKPPEGYPFFSGTACYTTEIEIAAQPGMDLCFSLTADVYDCVEMIINGNSLGVRAFTPYHFMCPNSLVRNGKNLITVKVTNTLVNMLDGKYFDYDKHLLMDV